MSQYIFNLMPASGRKTWTLKWFASIIQIMGYSATGFGFTPLNQYLFLVGLMGWFAVGIVWKDRAIILIHIIALGALLIGMMG